MGRSAVLLLPATRSTQYIVPNYPTRPVAARRRGPAGTQCQLSNRLSSIPDAPRLRVLLPYMTGGYHGSTGLLGDVVSNTA